MPNNEDEVKKLRAKVSQNSPSWHRKIVNAPLWKKLVAFLTLTAGAVWGNGVYELLKNNLFSPTATINHKNEITGLMPSATSVSFSTPEPSPTPESIIVDDLFKDSCDGGKDEFTVQESDTEWFCTNQISISVVNINYEGEPSRRVVYATVGSAKTSEKKKLKSANVGDSCVFEGFTVTVESIDAGDATFSVSRLTPTPTPTPTKAPTPTTSPTRKPTPTPKPTPAPTSLKKPTEYTASMMAGKFEAYGSVLVFKKTGKYIGTYEQHFYNTSGKAWNKGEFRIEGNTMRITNNPFPRIRIENKDRIKSVETGSVFERYR